LPIKSYNGKAREEIQLSYFVDLSMISNKKVLILDDIVDSGETILYVKNMVSQYTEKITICALLSRNNIEGIYGEEIKTNEWIQFPWEQG
jgi:hypoxanthine phosphoribosyltransferase